VKKVEPHFSSTQSGTVMIELALVIPVLLAVIFGTFEISRVLQTDQALITFTRQCARSIFRDCAEVTEDPFTPGSEVQTCMNGVYDDMLALANLAVPGAEIIWSVYDYKQGKIAFMGPPPVLEESTVTLLGINGVNIDSGKTSSGQRSRYTPPLPYPIFHQTAADDFPVVMMQGAGTLGKTKDRIAICEAYATYRPVITSSLSVFGDVLGLTRYEDALL